MKKFFQILFVAAMLFGVSQSVFSQTATEENNYLKIERTPVELKSRLKNVYTGYEYKVKNIYNEPIKIVSVSLWNDSSGTAAYLSTQKTNQQARDEVWAKGKSMALTTLSFSMIGAAVALPFATMKNSRLDKAAKSESEKFGKTNIQNVSVKPKETYIFKTIAYKNHTPAMRMIYINPLTDENMTILMKQ